MKIVLIVLTALVMVSSFSCRKRNTVKHDRYSSSEDRDARMNDKLDRMDASIESMDSSEE